MKSTSAPDLHVDAATGTTGMSHTGTSMSRTESAPAVVTTTTEGTEDELSGGGLVLTPPSTEGTEDGLRVEVATTSIALNVLTPGGSKEPKKGRSKSGLTSSPGEKMHLDRGANRPARLEKRHSVLNAYR